MFAAGIAGAIVGALISHRRGIYYALMTIAFGMIGVLAAQEMGLSVSDEDLRNAVMQRQEFQRNGVFDPDLYRRLLAANHLTPPIF